MKLDTTHYDAAARAEVLSDLVGKRVAIGSDGFIELVSVSGSDAEICSVARGTSGSAGKGPEDDRRLIRYLKRHSHTTPFEFADLTWCVRTAMDTWRQWIRHRMSSTNEYSTRYQPAIDATVQTDAARWRLQSKTNRQGSAGRYVAEWPAGYSPQPGCVVYDFHGPDGHVHGVLQVEVAKEDGNRLPTPGEFLSQLELGGQDRARQDYRMRLEFGVAYEQARKELPLSTLTEAYWKIDLHNLMHFLSLRMDSHAQLEIREYATVMGCDFVAKLFPYTWEAFNDFDFRRDARLLSRQEAAITRAIVQALRDGGPGVSGEASRVLFNEMADEFGWPLKGLERAEAAAKLFNLGLLDTADAA